MVDTNIVASVTLQIKKCIKRFTIKFQGMIYFLPE